MERRFDSRREKVREDCKVPPQVFNGMTERLVTFAGPYVERLCRPEQREHAQRYRTGNAAMQCNCPHCAEVIEQDWNADGLNYCTKCQKLFLVPSAVPAWILGILIFLAGCWLVLCWY
jgi:hypothetical protein